MEELKIAHDENKSTGFMKAPVLKIAHDENKSTSFMKAPDLKMKPASSNESID